MHGIANSLQASILLGLGIGVLTAGAAPGPGIPNTPFPTQDVFKVISRISGVSVLVNGMHDGYLACPTSRSLSFYDISKPYAPVRVSQAPSAHRLIPHTNGFSNDYPGKYAVITAMDGFDIMDWTDIRAPRLVKHVHIPGTRGPEGNDDHSSIFVAPYIYLGGEYGGLSVVDATDMNNPVIVKHVSTAAVGIGNMGPVRVVGDLLVIAGNESHFGIAFFDVSNPANPILIAVNKQRTSPSYDMQVYDNKVFYGERSATISIFDIANPAQSRLLGTIRHGGKPETFQMQDQFIHLSSSIFARTFGSYFNGYYKMDVSDPANGKIVGYVDGKTMFDSPDFTAVLGNLIAVGDVGARGTVFIPHQAEPDRTPPRVNMVRPTDGKLRQATTTLIGAVFTDAIDHAKINNKTFIVRPVGGAALTGKYSYQFNTVNFAPDQPLLPNTTYEVTVPAGGLSDLAGNAITAPFTSRFSTGTTLTAGLEREGLASGKLGLSIQSEPAGVQFRIRGMRRDGNQPVTLVLYDLNGQAIRRFEVPAGRETRTVGWRFTEGGPAPAPGAYTAVLEQGTEAIRKTFVLGK